MSKYLLKVKMAAFPKIANEKNLAAAWQRLLEQGIGASTLAIVCLQICLGILGENSCVA